MEINWKTLDGSKNGSFEIITVDPKIGGITSISKIKNNFWFGDLYGEIGTFSNNKVLPFILPIDHQMGTNSITYLYVFGGIAKINCSTGFNVLGDACICTSDGKKFIIS